MGAAQWDSLVPLLPEEMPMSVQPVQALCTVEDYFALERASEERHECLDGWLYVMIGESPEHGTISPMIVATNFSATAPGSHR